MTDPGFDELALRNWGYFFGRVLSKVDHPKKGILLSLTQCRRLGLKFTS